MIQLRQILFVSHEVVDELTHRAFEDRGFTIAVAKGYQYAFHQLLESRFDLVVLNLADSTEGIDFIKRIRETEDTKRLLVVALGEWGTGHPSLALAQGADAYEPTPIDAERLAILIESLLTGRAVTAGWSK